MEREGFSIRFWAYVIDGLLLTFLDAVAAGALTYSVLRGMGASLSDVTLMTVLVAHKFKLSLAMAVVYAIYLAPEILIAASPGKLVMGLRIRHEDGQPASFFQLLIRWAIKVLPYVCAALGPLLSIEILTFIGSIGCIILWVGCFLVLGASCQAFHDGFTFTAVFKKSLKEIDVQPGAFGTFVSEDVARASEAMPNPDDLFKPRW